MGLFVAVASTSIVFAAFCWVAQVPDHHQRQHVYRDKDGEALPTKDEKSQDKTVRMLAVLLTLTASLLSVWNWVVQSYDTGLAIIAVAWVHCQPDQLRTCLTTSADYHHCGISLACSTLFTEAAALHYRLANSSIIAHVVARLGNHYIQRISRPTHVLVTSCPWDMPGLYVLLSAEASDRVSQRP